MEKPKAKAKKFCALFNCLNTDCDPNLTFLRIIKYSDYIILCTKSTLISSEEENCSTLTTSFGIPVVNIDFKTTLNRNLIRNNFVLETMMGLSHERIPERVVHAKGAGAFGYFEVTHDAAKYNKAKLFEKIGKRTPVAVRFSGTATDKAGADTKRDIRGFAIKFYTEEGIWDLVGLNSPIFNIIDPLFFVTTVRAQKRNPATNLNDANMLWDFLTSIPTAIFQFMIYFSDRGVPKSFRHIQGFGVHTFQVVNSDGESYFVRIRLDPDAGVESITEKEANKIAGDDPDYYVRDLYNAIDKGNYPSWSVSWQVLTLQDVKDATFDVFDVTKILPVGKYPLQPVGRLVLNRNPVNFFAEIEQLAFDPGNLGTGVLGAPDKLFEARMLAYRDAQNYRLGANFNKIIVNSPKSETHTYKRDGRPPTLKNEEDSPNYFPNSFNGACPCLAEKYTPLIKIKQSLTSNFDQVRELYTNEFTKEERARTIDNIVKSLSSAADFLQNKAINLFASIHSDLGKRVARGLGKNCTEF